MFGQCSTWISESVTWRSNFRRHSKRLQQGKLLHPLPVAACLALVDDGVFSCELLTPGAPPRHLGANVKPIPLLFGERRWSSEDRLCLVIYATALKIALVWQDTRLRLELSPFPTLNASRMSDAVTCVALIL